jgi:hypothetical protein
MASPTIEDVSPGLLRRAWRKSCRFWRLVDAIGSILLGSVLTACGLALLVAGVADLLRGLVSEFGFGCAFAALFVGGGIYCVNEGVKALREWWRPAN